MNPPDPVPGIDLAGCLISDRRNLARLAKTLRARRAKGLPCDELQRKFDGMARRSRDVVERRTLSGSAVSVPDSLPISAAREEIGTLIRQNPVLVLCGETGSGKSTQLPKICLGLDRGIVGRIGHTQPRRIAARSLAARISTELQTEPGNLVGYKVRFKDQVRPETRIKLMTDGILLAEIQRDPFLNEYDTLIIDEAHERTLNIDFLLGYLRQLLPKRPDLKLVITSATIDPKRFSDFFAAAPIVEVSGRTFPVEVRYRPPAEEGAGERDDSLQMALVDAVDEVSRHGRGDILVFCSGEHEIRESAESLRKHHLDATELLPLYARQSAQDQARIFRASKQRRIVIATNVAETSLTVPGIHYVIDTGFARVSRYSHASKVQRLPVERISRASAEQRKGRCGRIAEGVCVRLYTEEDYAARREFTDPEILRTNLASVVLQMEILGFGDVTGFPFLDPPDSRLVRDGYRVLHEIGAVDGAGKVTRLGRQLARLPVDPRLGRMLLEAAHTHCLKELLVIVAALSVQDPRERPAAKRQQADQAHALFKDEDSDFRVYLNLWEYVEEKRRHLSRRKFRELCISHYLSPNRVLEWHDTHHQLRSQLHEMGYRENQVEAGYEPVHKAILAGLLSHIGMRAQGAERGYTGGRNSRFFLFPGSVLFEKRPKWVVAAELVETTKLYARTLAMVRPEWVESLAGHLVKRRHSEPHWQARRGQVAAYEKVTLFGLTLVARRRVNFGPIDPETASDVFIRSALVDGDFETRAPFWRHNQELIAGIRDLEAKSRSRDILVDEEALYAFYASRLPAGIYSKPDFERWYREATRKDPKLLHLRDSDVMRHDAPAVTAERFPETLDIAGARLPLRYCFDPGARNDGITLMVPLRALKHLSGAHVQWLVPGMLRERVIALMKGLPKSLRRQLVPVPDIAGRFVAAAVPGRRTLAQSLSEYLLRAEGIRISETAWSEADLPDHLRMNVRVLDAGGGTLAEGRDLTRLKAMLADQDAEAPTRQRGLERQGVRQWDFGDLPPTVDIRQAGITLPGFPALVDRGDHVDIKILDSAARAGIEHRAGLTRLFKLALGRLARDLRKIIADAEHLRLAYAMAAETGMPGPRPAAGKPDDRDSGDLVEQIIDLAVIITFLGGPEEIRTAAAFNQALDEHRALLVSNFTQIQALVSDILHRYHKARLALAAIRGKNREASLADMREQLDALVFRGFVTQVPYQRLADYPRYLKALTLRAQKLDFGVARDQRLMAEMTPLYRQWRELYRQAHEKGETDERLDEMRWEFEELRISLFAQEVKAAYPVSVKRLEKRWRAFGF